MSDATGPLRRKRLSWESRCEIVAKVRLQGMSPELAAASSGVHRSTAYRLLARFDAGGWAGLRERRPVPVRQPRRSSAALELAPGEPAGARGGLAGPPALPLPEADWPRAKDAGPSRAARAGAWVRAHRLDLCIVGALSLVLGTVHAWGMGRYPAFFDDEGTYVSQAWSVNAFQELSPYTYWYDHPPLGWILLAGWARVVPTFGSDLYSIATARTFMVLIFVLSACLLYVVARRLGVRRPFAALAVLLFGLSPLAVYYHRMVLLDNIAVCWLLAAFALALSPRRRLWAYAGSGVCLAAASLTKETFVLFAPALALAVWQHSAGRTRRFALAVFGALFALVLAFYPLFALLRGELLSGAGHTSLVDGVRFQLTRPGSGSILDPGSGSRELIDSWLSLDWILLALGVAALPIALVFRQLLPFAIALLIPLVMAARPGTYLPAMYVIGLLPFAALLAGAVADRLWRPEAARQWLAACGGPFPMRSVAGSAAVAYVLVVLALLVPLRWSTALATQTGTDLNRPYRQTIAWLEANADRDSTILVDNTIWTDLVHRGFTRARTVWFYKLDLDPAIRIARQEFDYIVRTNLFAGNLDDLPRSRELFETSVPVASFSAGPETIEIRRVLHAGPAQQTPAEKRSGASGRG